MERPRLRRLEAFPVNSTREMLLALRDPSGMTEAVAFLPPAAVWVVELFDGQRDRKDILAEFERRHGKALPAELLDRLIGQLDEALLLDSDRYRQHAEAARAAFAAAPVRTAAHAGRSYPGEPTELRAFLAPHFVNGSGGASGSGGAGAAAAGPPPDGAPLRGLIAPHIDLHRGGPAYGRTYASLAESEAEVFVIFGTDHTGLDHPFTLTRKHYDTPLGSTSTDVALVDALSRRLGDDPSLFADELHHRTEHSIEFQALLLRHVLGPDRPILVLPVLCGSLHRDLEAGRDPAAGSLVGRFLEALSQLLAGRRTVVIAGADFAHVGPRFGDPAPLGPEQRARLRQADAESLDACARADAFAFWETVRKDGDARRICGLAPIYHTLRLLSGTRGEVLCYDQCAADDDGGSLVSIGGVALR